MQPPYPAFATPLRDISPTPSELCVHRIFRARAARKPEGVALLQGERTLTYAQLDAWSDRLAGALRARAVGREVLVGLLLPRSIEAVVAMLGILKAGGAYVPLDPAYPADRLCFQVEDTGMRVCVTDDPSLLSRLGPDVAAQPIAERALPEERLSPALDEARPDDLLYVLHTSGTTGRPKGVCGVHGSTVNRLQWMWQAYPFQEGEVAAHRTALGFVDSVAELFGPLLQGVPVGILPPQVTADPGATMARLASLGATRVTLVPSLLRAFLDLRPDLENALPAVRLWIVSGERLAASLLARFRSGVRRARLLNLYGSTEVAGDVTWAELAPDGPEVHDPVPIGQPIPGARLHVLDADMRPVAVGEVGELYVSGPVLARGYHHRPEETRTRFLPGPDGSPLFRTGDRVFFDGSRVYFHVGRSDHQVKIRGVRVEMEEVEAAVHRASAGVRQVAAVAQGDDEAGFKLIVFVTPATVDVPALAEALRERLPEAMQPARIVALEDLPLTPSGKIDRHRLSLRRDVRVLQVPPAELPRTPTERWLAELWAEQLHVGPIPRSSDYYELGGDSLSLVACLAALRKRLGITVPLEHGLGRVTLKALAAWVDGRRDAASQEDARFILGPLTKPYLQEAVQLLARSFVDREPLARLAGATEADITAILSPLSPSDGHGLDLSRIALETASGRVVAVCLCEDATWLAPEEKDDTALPLRLRPVFALLDTLKAAYRAQIGPVIPGKVLEVFMTATADDVDGFSLALALEQQVVEDAVARGYERVVSLCTHRVTAYLAIHEAGFQVMASVPYARFEHEGRLIFAEAAPIHGEAVLVERRLSTRPR
jgi:amino acid adenylation domain-containing protein